MTSLRYKVVARGVRRMSHKTVFSMGPEELEEWLVNQDQAKRRKPLASIRRGCSVKRREYAGRSCYIIEPKGGWQPGSPVVLFLHGGGFIFEAWKGHWRAAAKIVRRLGAQLWFCNYPLLPKATLESSSNMVTETYMAMLDEHPAEDIRIIGDSAGAIHALILGHRFARGELFRGKALPMPKMMALLSPGQSVIRDPAIRRRMEALESTDVMLGMGILDALNDFMQVMSGETPHYACPFEGSFTGFPPLLVFCGTREIFKPQMEGFIKQVKDTGGSVEFIVGEGMCHVWPYVPFAPECKAAFELLLERLCRGEIRIEN